MNKIKLKQIDEITADNVVMAEDLIVTKSVGEITVPQGSSVTISHKIGERNKTVSELLDEMFSKTVPTTYTTPKIEKVSIKYSGQNCPVSLEYGTLLDSSLVARFRFNPGEYSSKNPTPTGSTLQNAEIQLLVGGESVNTDSLSMNTDYTYSLNGNQLVKKYEIKVSGMYTRGDAAFDNKGNPTDVRIPAGTHSMTYDIINVYRAGFIGNTYSTIRTIEDLGDTEDASNKIRKLGSFIPKAETRTFTTTLSGGASLIIALPSSAGLLVQKVTIPAQADTDITSDVKLIGNAYIHGAENSEPELYYVWSFAPDALDADVTYKILIGSK